MDQLSSLNTNEPIDYDNLNIVIHPRPPRRRQSGASLVPFRPYVKCLTSIREPFSYVNGQDRWVTSGQKETFFKQDNARCIGSLLDDCDVSDVIRWDIEGESTRLPMMCKLWIIVDGAVVERGKPHLVQDAAVQVFTTGRNRRSILEAEKRYNPSVMTTFNRRRRQSWHDVNEYHSVPYYQYTRAVRSGHQEYVQCDLDDEQLIGTQDTLASLDETLDEHLIEFITEDQAKESIHNQSLLHDRSQISIMTQTEQQLMDSSTGVDHDFIHMFNLNLETNENLLSSTVNPYVYRDAPHSSWEITSLYRRGVEYINRSVSTGDDYPQWWLQLSTNVILSNQLTKQGEAKEIVKEKVLPSQSSPLNFVSSLPPPTIRLLQEQSVQTESEKSVQTEVEQVVRPSSTRSSRVRNSSSSMTMSNHYQFIDEIDDGNNDQRNLPFPDYRQRNDSHGDLESRSSDFAPEYSFHPVHHQQRIRRATTSSKHSDTDYNAFASALDHRPYSTPDHQLQSSTNEQKLNRSKTSQDASSTSVLSALFERYERTLKVRQRPIAVVNDELFDIDDVLKYYRQKIDPSSQTTATTTTTTSESIRPIEVPRDVTSVLSSTGRGEDRRSSCSSSISRLSKKKHRTRPAETHEQMLQVYLPSPRLQLTNLLTVLPDERANRYDYYDLTLTDENLNSAWIRFNEQRIDQIQKRIDLMLQIDDNEEAQMLLSHVHPVTNTVTDHIDDILLQRTKHRNPTIVYSTSNDQIILPRRNQFRLPFRLNQSVPESPRLTSRNVSRSTTPTAKTSVRISTKKDRVIKQIRFDEETLVKSSNSRPTTRSILRRQSTNSPNTRSRRVVDKSHIWKNDIDGKVYILDQFSIPRYYRLYNDVSFREVYQFSRLLESYIERHETANDTYTSMIKEFALEQRLPAVTTVA